MFTAQVTVMSYPDLLDIGIEIKNNIMNIHEALSLNAPNQPENIHYVNVSILIKFSQKTSVFTLIIVSSP